MQILMVCSSCKISYYVLSHSHDCHNFGPGSICMVGGGGWRVGWGFVDMPLGVGVLQKIDQKVSRF